jgi:16S rRNA (cytosine1402-N4)-methyltransferase
MNAMLFERPVRFATGPLLVEEEAHAMEDVTYHRPVLATETVELLAPRPGSLIVDGTCGGGGHTEAILRAGARFSRLIRTRTRSSLRRFA